MPVQLGALGQPDFSQPIELMMDCHRRIEHFLGVLERVTRLHAEEPLTDEARRALLTSLDYFRHAAPKHTADEEESLLPRLRAMESSELAPVIEEASRIEADHRRAAAMHDWVDLAATRWLDNGLLDGDEMASLRQTLRTLRRLYAGHIAFEDQRLFPAAASALDEDALAEIGREMAGRRNGAGGPASDPSTEAARRPR